jgi:Holliday junction resolvasome RuvABC endonuclease subunit
MRTLFVGVDPAKTGAATVLDSDGILCGVVLWRTRTRKKVRCYEVKTFDAEEGTVKTQIIPNIIFIGKIINEFIISKGTEIHLACEDCFVRLNPKIAINLARLSGQIVSPIEYHFNVESKFVRANDWRKAVIGGKNYTERKTVKKQSLQFIPYVLPCIKQALTALGQHDHVTDSAGIALWCYYNHANS